MSAPANGRGWWWWLKPEHSHARCTATTKDPYYPGRCKGFVQVDGLCKVHARIAGKLPKPCASCGGSGVEGVVCGEHKPAHPSSARDSVDTCPASSNAPEPAQAH